MSQTPLDRPGRPLKVGFQLPEVEREVRWPEILEMVRVGEDVGFDSIWVGDHLLYQSESLGSRGPWEAWTSLAAIAASTSRIALGPLVACTSFHNPAMLAKMAATVDDVSGGRLILGLGAGWNETEYRAFGFPYDRRVARFEEAFTIIRTLLAEGRIDFSGEFYEARDCELLPRPPRNGGPPLLIGSNGERMLSIAIPNVAAWNTWFDFYGNSPEGFDRANAAVSRIARDVGRNPAEIARSACVFVVLDRDGAERPIDVPPVEGAPEEIAGYLRTMADAGADEVILVVTPMTELSIRHLGRAIAVLDGRVPS